MMISINSLIGNLHLLILAKLFQTFVECTTLFTNVWLYGFVIVYYKKASQVPSILCSRNRYKCLLPDAIFAKTNVINNKSQGHLSMKYFCQYKNWPPKFVCLANLWPHSYIMSKHA